MFEVKVKVKVGKKRPYEGRAANPVAAFPEVVWLQARVFLQSLAPMDECDKPMIFDWAVRYGEACSVRYVQTATLPRSLPAGSAPSSSSGMRRMNASSLQHTLGLRRLLICRQRINTVQSGQYVLHTVQCRTCNSSVTDRKYYSTVSSRGLIIHP